MIPKKKLQTIYYIFDRKSVFDKKSQSIPVDTHKIMRKYKEKEPFPLRIEGIRMSPYA